MARKVRTSNGRPKIELQLTVQQIAALHAVTSQTVLTWIDQGQFREYLRLPGKRGDVRIPLSAYQDFVERQTVSAA